MTNDFDISIFDSIPSIPVTQPEDHEYELVPAGTFIARCFSIVDLGTQEDTYNGELTHNRKVSIRFELPTKLNSKFEPFTTYVDYNLFLGEKSNLRKFLQSWRGGSYSDQELKNFHIYKEFLNRPCQLTIEHKTSAKGKKYPKISSISPLMEGIECPDRFNDIHWLSLDSFSRDSFESINDKLKEIIKKSPEYNALQF